jgi:predicted nucleic acid-binding protein
VFAGLLDACVLVPSLLRDLLLQVAAQGVYRPLWSQEILNEMTDAVVEIKAKREPDQASHVRAAMSSVCDELNLAFPDAMVGGWYSLTPGLMLPDPDDRHVVAAAVAGRADVIITENVGDFPRWAMPARVKAQPPDEFFLFALDLYPRSFVSALRAVAANSGRRGGATLCADEVLDRLEKRLPHATAAARLLD